MLQILVEFVVLSTEQVEAHIFPLLLLSTDNFPTYPVPHEVAYTQAKSAVKNVVD